MVAELVDVLCGHMLLSLYLLKCLNVLDYLKCITIFNFHYVYVLFFFLWHTSSCIPWKTYSCTVNFFSVHARWSYWECLVTLWVSSLLRVWSPLLPFPSTDKENSTQWTIMTYSTASAETPTKSKIISVSWNAPPSLYWTVNSESKAV